MSKNLNILPYVTSSVGFAPTEGTWDFLQQSHKEDTNEIILRMIGESYDNTKAYRLWGADLIDIGGDSYPNTVGAIFYQAQIYHVDAVGSSGTNMPDGFDLKIVKTQYTLNADPSIFTDSSSHNVHDILKMAYIDAGTAGALGIGEPLDFQMPEKLKTIASYNNITNPNYLDLKFKRDSITIANSYLADVGVTIRLDNSNAVIGCVNVVKFPYNIDVGFDFVCLNPTSASIIILKSSPEDTDPWDTGVSGVRYGEIKYLGVNTFIVKKYVTA